jgi:hypothetical protein
VNRKGSHFAIIAWTLLLLSWTGIAFLTPSSEVIGGMTILTVIAIAVGWLTRSRGDR